MSKCIFAIEDEQDIREVLEILLTAEGYQVKTFPKGQGIYSEIEETAPDLIIMDIMLGDINGMEVCRMLKENRLTQNIPVIMLSGHQDLLITSHVAGANDFIAKPFDIDNLLDAVEKHLAA